ncbi:uncharacterized protein LOC110990089 [Acanthaster planci]|uniref:Uncharacterized protein LOC110990089 n=1 Tax=Acanthaster planci TaxID=133434 RepID=A0A8B7ZZR4_ACAPL|nr:uncharacterized protein LOC110990089 [Acanthaster planci]
MSQKTIQQLDEDSKATGVVYNHSNAKLFTRKSKVRKRRKEGFLSAFPCRKNEPSPSLTTMKPKRKPVSKSITSNTKQKLQVCVRTHLPQGPKTLCFHLNLETTISSLKRLIYRKIGVQPQRQRLNIRRNVQLCELLTLRENGVGDDEISLSVDELTEDGPKAFSYFNRNLSIPRRSEKAPARATRRNQSRELNKQKGETISEVQTQIDEPARGSEGPRVPRYRHVKQKLQIFILNPLLRGPRTLCFHLEPETPISFLKESIHRKIGVHPKHQRLLIRRNARSFQLLDLLTLNDCGVQQDENISVCLPTDGLLGGGQKAYPSPTIEPATVAILFWSVSLAAIVVWILWRKQRKTSTRELNDKVPLSTTTGEDDEKGTGNETEMQQNDSEEDPSVSTVSDGDPVDDGYDGSKETLITKGQVQDPLLGIEKQQNERGQTSSEATASGGDPAEHAVDRCADVLKTLYMTTDSWTNH